MKQAEMAKKLKSKVCVYLEQKINPRDQRVT